MNKMDFLPDRNNGHQEANGAVSEPRQVTIQDYIRVLFKNRFLILISFAVVLAATAYFTFTTEPVYESSAKVMVEEQPGVGESLFDITSMMKKETMINNQVEILKSRTLAEQVIQKLQLSSRTNRLQILGYVPEDEKSGEGIFGFLRGLTGGQDADSVPDPATLFHNYVQDLRSRISVNPIRNTDMIEITYSAHTPSEAAYVCNTIAGVFQERNRAQSQQEVRQVKNFLQEQLELYQQELARSEEALKDYQEEAKVVALDRKTEELVTKIAEFESMLNSARTDYQALIQRLNYIDNKLDEKNVDLDMESISSEPYLAELKRQIAEKEAELAKFEASMVEVGDYARPEAQVQLKKRQIQALKEKFKTEVSQIAASQFVDPAVFSGDLFRSKIEVETELQAIGPRIDALERIVSQYSEELESLPEKSLRLARLMRKRQSDEKIYIMLQEKYQESRITEVGQLGNIRLIDPAIAPKYPVKPRKKLNLVLGMLVGLGLGVGIAFVTEYLDHSVQSIEDVEAMGVPIVGNIPYIRPEEGNGMLSRIQIQSDPEAEDINERLVTHLRPRSPISEAYRTLRTNILFSSSDSNRKTLMVTSSGPKEGKSTTVSNLAITFAQMGNKTLLIDADMRRPILHKLFGLEKTTGLTNILVGRADLQDAVRQNPGLPDLDILSCGVIPPNPAELLGSESMRQLLETVKSRYNVILIDTPPSIAVTDASILASLVDGVLLVIRAGETPREAAKRSFEQLYRVNAPLVGAVLNGIQASNVYGSYYYYYQYHYYHGDDDSKKRRRRHKKERS